MPVTSSSKPAFAPHRHSASCSRRQFVSASAAGAVGAFWSNLLRATTKAPPQKEQKAKSVILIFNCGAPSHIDLWDMKPQATSEIRGVFSPIATNVQGMQVSELMPGVAKHADKLAIVRSVHHRHSGHNAGMHWSIVGRPYREDGTLFNPSRTDYPSFGTLAGWLAQRDGYSGAIPPYVITPAPHCDSLVYITPGQFGSCLGARFDPFVLNSDPNSADFKVPNLGLSEGMTTQRLRDRGELLEKLDDAACEIEHDAAREIAVHRGKAMSLVTSTQAAGAFDLSKEPPPVRERYGRHTWGQSHLLARRLVEAGVRFVTTVNGQSIVWDTHADNFNRLKNNLVPPMESAYAALLDDLEQRGLLDTTLVVWMGDFGRTPKINAAAGRDHWPQCYSVVLAGGGIRGGQVVGASDKTGAYPAERPITPADIHATVFSLLGYDAQAITYQTADGRPTPVSEGEVIRELV